MAGAGDLNRAEALARQAEALARSITDPDWQAQALAALARMAARTGDLDRAEALARSITDPDGQAQALATWRMAAARVTWTAPRRWPGRPRQQRGARRPGMGRCRRRRCG